MEEIKRIRLREIYSFFRIADTEIDVENNTILTDAEMDNNNNTVNETMDAPEDNTGDQRNYITHTYSMILSKQRYCQIKSPIFCVQVTTRTLSKIISN